MPENRGSNSLKDPELYEELRKDGASKEKAARISNAAARDGRDTVGERGGAAGSYEDWTVKDLRARAKKFGLTGYSEKKKAELIDMLREH
ncbi:SAP domain-containing protein [Microbacterium chocolatum]|uniref:SAP domain-containing protein n=1 Tax=Microbacterium aurantiacum TaxID=162393 RepID=UPI00338E08A1